ncbi:hypothetical protein UK15_13210 [Streptomyces variegatus]|uniref:Uncharacterized protein n=1 Tax=Streptomyces variegatus TaxID=284040 RepID=A0A0M2GV44_9ACTN|nr:hypothetical protein UK15_13210 [Streptomyces variegatus]
MPVRCDALPHSTPQRSRTGPEIGALALRFSGSAPTLVSGLSGSAPHVGIAVGSWTAGMALSSPLGQAGPPLVGTVAAALTLVP